MAYRVYFGRLPESLSQDDFEKMLEEHGKARNIEWKSGYAYVDYKHGSDASKTVQNLNGKEVGGNNILVELAQNGGRGYAVAGTFAPRPFVKPPPSRPVRTPHRVRIENLSSRAKWMELKELLSLAGEVTFADTHKRKTGEGIVEFATRKDMDEAIKTFHNTTFFGKTIKLYDESLNRGRSRSPKSRSHSRHRSSERKRRTRSKSSSPQRKTSSRRRSASPRKRSPRRRSASPKRRSGSKDRNRSRRRRSRSRTPTRSSRNSHKKSRKSKRDSSPRSRSKSPRSKKERRSNSKSGSDNNNDSKRKSKKKRSSSKSLSNSDSDNKSK